jgi:hypothetical protein
MPTKPDLLPSLPPEQHLEMDYVLQDFQPIDEAAQNKETTISDLALLNNSLAMCSAVLPHVKTIDSLVSLNSNICKLIETRRKVKELPFGQSEKKGGRVYEVIE